MLDDWSVKEREKYDRMWDVAKYRVHSPALRRLSHVKEVLETYECASVMDFGCGTGKAALALKNAGYTVLAIDISDKALDPEPREKLHFAQRSLWDMSLPPMDWGICHDVMEHIPEEMVSKTLETISRHCKKGATFSIACFQDGFGRYIGETLHLTVKEPEWWKAQLAEHFGSEISSKFDGRRCLHIDVKARGTWT